MSRCLYRPRGVRVRLGAGGAPAGVGRTDVEAVREQWLIEDRWWTARPLRRCYFELVMADGRDTVVFCEMDSGRWYSQRA